MDNLLVKSHSHPKAQIALSNGSPAAFSSAIDEDGRIRQGWAYKIDAARQAAIAELNSDPSRFNGAFGSLDELLAPIVGTDNLESLSVSSEVHAHMAKLLLAKAVIEVATVGPTIRFTEVPISVTTADYWLSAGVADDIQLVRIGDKAPTPAQLRMIKPLTDQKHDLTTLIPLLQRIFDAPIGLRLGDYKISFADGVIDSSGNLPHISPTDQLPVKGHESQLVRYDTVGALGVNIQLGRNDTDWSGQQLFDQAIIDYRFPDQTDIRTSLVLDPKVREAHFERFIARPWNTIKARREAQMLGNWLLRFAIALWDGRSLKEPKIKSNGYHHEDAPATLMDMPKQADPLVAAIERYREKKERARVWQDPDQTVEEITTRAGYKMSLIHLDRAERTWLGPVDWERSRITGHCPVHIERTGHPDKTKSLSIYLPRPDETVREYRRPTAKCFGIGCNFYAYIASESVAPAISQTWKYDGRKVSYAPPSRGVPDELHRVLLMTQEVLQAAFRHKKNSLGQKGRAYLEGRKIDPTFAYDQGVGLATFNLVPELMSQGLSFEELVQSGVISYGERGSARLIKFLGEKGLSDSEIIRSYKNQVTGSEVRRYPYIALGDDQTPRVTAPLESFDPEADEWRIDNFAGRAIVPTTKEGIHRKMPSPFYRISPGAAGAKAAFESDHDMIIPVEAWIDRLSLMQMGYEPVVAAAGIDNPKFLAQLAQSDKRPSQVKDILLALDNDNPGRTATSRIMGDLRERGFKGRFGDLTQYFRNTYTAFASVKDWNEWLVRTEQDPNFKLWAFDSNPWRETTGDVKNLAWQNQRR